MKKSLLFAFLVASVMAFTSCKSNNEPDAPKSITLKEMVGTKWRVDSAYVDEGRGVLTGLYQAFEIKSETTYKYLQNDEVYNFSVKDHKVTIEDLVGDCGILTVIEATDQYIHMEGTTPTYDEHGDITGSTKLRLSLGRIPDSNGEKVSLAKENIVGVWKADYYVENGVYSGSGEPWTRFLISINYHGLDVYTFKEDGTFVFENLMEKWLSGAEYEQQGGFWRIEGDRLIVPEYNGTVRVSGNVMFPNTVAYEEGKDYKYFVNQAGGFGNRAKKSKTYVIYMNGTISQVGHGTKIEPGCEIVVPTKSKKEPFNWGVLATLGSSMASLATLVLAITKL